MSKPSLRHWRCLSHECIHPCFTPVISISWWRFAAMKQESGRVTGNIHQSPHLLVDVGVKVLGSASRLHFPVYGMFCNSSLETSVPALRSPFCIWADTWLQQDPSSSQKRRGRKTNLKRSSSALRNSSSSKTSAGEASNKWTTALPSGRILVSHSHW